MKKQQDVVDTYGENLTDMRERQCQMENSMAQLTNEIQELMEWLRTTSPQSRPLESRSESTQNENPQPEVEDGTPGDKHVFL